MYFKMEKGGVFLPQNSPANPHPGKGKSMKREKTKYQGIYKVGDVYYITYYVGPKKCEKAVGSNLSIAIREKMEREDSAKSGKYSALENQEKMTMEQLIETYRKEGDGKGYILLNAGTYIGFFGNRKLSEISRKDIFNFRDNVKSTPKKRGSEEVTNSHVNRVLAGLRRLFNFAINRELMLDTPFPKTSKSGLYYPEPKGLRNFFTEEQMIRILDASPEWLRPMVLTAFYTGMREGELRGLQWEWVDLQEGVIYLPSSKTLKDSTGRGQRIVMQGELVDLFKSLPKRSEWVFCKPDGTPYSHANIFKAFRRVLKSLKIDTKRFSWKELRHTTASMMNLKGAPPMAIKDQLRHTTVATTESFYIGSDLEFQRQQIEKLILRKEVPSA